MVDLGHPRHGAQVHDSHLGIGQRIGPVGHQPEREETAADRIGGHQADRAMPLAAGQVDALRQVGERAVQAQQLLAA